MCRQIVSQVSTRASVTACAVRELPLQVTGRLIYFEIIKERCWPRSRPHSISSTGKATASEERIIPRPSGPCLCWLPKYDENT